MRVIGESKHANWRCSLRVKIILKLVMYLALALAVIGLARFFLLLGNISSLETENSKRDAKRIMSAFTNLVNEHSDGARDWAYWTDLHRYMQTRDSAFRQANLQESALHAAGWNYLALFDSKGSNIFLKSHWLGSHEKQPLSEEVRDRINNIATRYFLSKPRDAASGIAKIGPIPYIIYINRLRRTDGSGDNYGYIFAARQLNSELLSQVSNSVLLHVHLYDGPFDIKSGEALGDVPGYLKPISNERTELHLRISGLSEEDTFSVKAVIQKDIYRKTIPYNLALFYLTAAIGLIFITYVWFIFDKEVLLRLIQLRSELNSIRNMSSDISRVSDVKNDEIGQLAHDINALLVSKDDYAKELADAHETLIHYLSAIPFILVLFDKDGVLVDANDQALVLFEDKYISGHQVTIWDFPLGKDKDSLTGLLEGMLVSRKPLMLPMINAKTPEGDKVLDIVISLVTMAHGSYRFLLSAIDVSDKFLLQRQLANAQKLESIGHLAAGIAHEINTPTQYVTDNMHFLNEATNSLNALMIKLKERASVLEDRNIANYIEELENEHDATYLYEQVPIAINQSIEGLYRITTIVKAMKEFAHPPSETMNSADLNRAIESTTSISRNEWKYVADLELDLDPNLPAIDCSINEINQVVLNILVNAAHSIQDKVQDSGNKGLIKIKTLSINKNEIEITISDTGKGIPEEIRNRIFDPFFTTKDVGKGTGQGLSIAYNVIVKHHNGGLSFESTIDKGTTFHIRLPISQDIKGVIAA